MNLDKPDPVLQATNGDAVEAPALPDWCDVYRGLSDEEVADLERVILQRADFSHTS